MPRQRSNSNHFYVITGASGAGKSTLIAALAAQGYLTVPEAALALVKEQPLNSQLLPSKNRQAFMQAVLERNIQQYQQVQTQIQAQIQATDQPVFFDRGIPECLAWMQMMKIPIPEQLQTAAEHYRYAPFVFVAEPWPEIYVMNDDRPFPFERAIRSFEATVSGYLQAGYTSCILPKNSVEKRVQFILKQISKAIR